MHYFAFPFIFIFLLCSLSSCRTLDPDQQKELDPTFHRSKEEIETLLTHTPTSPLPTRRPFVPVVKKPAPPAAFSRLISLSLTEGVPLKDIFFQLARQAKVNLSLTSGIKGTATLHVHQQPFIDVVKELCAVNKLRYRLDHQILRIEPDEPYLHNYNVQFLSIVRNNQSRSSITTDVFTPSRQPRGGNNTHSNNVLTSEIRNDLWMELKTHLTTFLQEPSGDNSAPLKEGQFAIHQQAGLISIYATQAKHQEIEHFLKMLRRSLSSQVIIEAKIIEVLLKDEFKTGINWNFLKGDMVLQAPLGDLTRPGAFDKNNLPLRDVFTIGGKGKQLTEILSLMKKFGNVRALASPRLNAMNNQPTFMKFATEYVYFNLNYNRETNSMGTRDREQIVSSVQSIPIGLVLLVHPSINMEDGSVTLALRPTITRVINEKLDPALSYLSKEVHKSYVPEVQVREVDAMARVKPGQIVVLAGLLEEIARNDQSAIPFIDEIPLLGNLAKATADKRDIIELVIFITVKIVDDQEHIEAVQESSVTPADKQLYESFVRDSRPLEMGS